MPIPVRGHQRRMATVLVGCLAMLFLVTCLFAPIWHDEALILLEFSGHREWPAGIVSAGTLQSAMHERTSFAQLFSDMARLNYDIHPPLYYVLLWCSRLGWQLPVFFEIVFGRNLARISCGVLEMVEVHDCGGVVHSQLRRYYLCDDGEELCFSLLLDCVGCLFVGSKAPSIERGAHLWQYRRRIGCMDALFRIISSRRDDPFPCG